MRSHLMVAYTLRQNVGTHLQVATDECATQEFAFHNVFSAFRETLVQLRYFLLLAT